MTQKAGIKKAQASRAFKAETVSRQKRERGFYRIIFVICHQKFYLVGNANNSVAEARAKKGGNKNENWIKVRPER